MPQKTTHKRTARTIRQGTGKRKNRSPAGRQQSNRSKANIAANSIGSLFTIKLAAKPAYKLQDEISPFEAPVKDMASQLLQSVNYALKALGKQHLIKTKKDLKGADVMEHCLATLKAEVLPEGFEYNIEKDGAQYFFVLYKALHLDWHWHYFPIEPIIKYLERTDIKLLKLYLSALNVMRKHLDISTWFGGYTYVYGMMGDEWWFNDFLDSQIQFDTEEENKAAIEKWNATRDSYLTGEIHQYSNKLCKAHFHLPTLNRQLKQYNAGNKVVGLINKILELAKTGYSINNFNYDPIFDDNYNDGDPITLDQELTIIWTEDDECFDVECEYIDIHSGEFGVMEPTISIPLNHKTKKTDFEGFDKKQEFFKQLTKLWHLNYALTRDLKKQNERFNKKHNG